MKDLIVVVFQDENEVELEMDQADTTNKVFSTESKDAVSSESIVASWRAVKHIYKNV